MGITYNGVEIKSVTYNGTQVQKVTFNGSIVWTAQQNIVSCTVSGTEEVGKTLTASVMPLGATVTYKWYRGSTVISGATSSTYKLVDKDRAKQIKCKVTGTGMYTGSVTSSPTGKIYGWKQRTGNLYSMTSATTPSPFRVLSGLWRFFASLSDIDTSMGLPSGVASNTSVIDLGSNHRITNLTLKFANKFNAYSRGATCTITVKSSVDNSSWTTIVNNKDMSTDDSHVGTPGLFPKTADISITEKNCRYLKITTDVSSVVISNAWWSYLQVSGWKEWSNS